VVSLVVLMKQVDSIDTYIDGFPVEVQKILQKLRQTIHKEAPRATEAISYGIPTFKLHGNLIHFGGFKNHVSLFPGSEAVEVFEKELSDYETSKGTIQFPLDKPIPYALVRKITKFRVTKSLEAIKKRR
jgi:uncharacterized protein YdhG (YjbR/CyaY superfamily)